TTTQLHRLRGVDERYIVVQGHGRVSIGQIEPENLGPGDVVAIPAGTAQQITNIGDNDLIFYCICSPGFFAECYESLEN
ncbi:MAG: cupin domain-containing protein, partial [Roseiflexaceae bacterium]|nr:cupin domain-containing protein [Roseiflexaceae bacterium]